MESFKREFRKHVLKSYYSIMNFYIKMQKFINLIIIQLRIKITLKDFLYIYDIIDTFNCFYEKDY